MGGPEPVFEAGEEGYDDCFSLVGLGGVGVGMAPFIDLAVVLVVVVSRMFHMDWKKSVLPWSSSAAVASEARFVVSLHAFMI